MNALKQLAIPLAGFGVGWAGWDYLEKNDVLTPDHHRQLAIWRLQLMKGISSVVPAGTLELSSEEIAERLELLYKSMEPQPDNRVKFVEVLQQCRIQEQLEWMEEHAEEEIPFFFIADLFHAFGALHEAELALNKGRGGSDASSVPSSSPETTTGGTSSVTATATDLPLEDDKRYASPILTRRTFEMMVTGVMPFDVASRVLGVLAVKSKSNRKQLLDLVSAKDGTSAVSTIIAKWADYHADMKEKGTPEGDAIVSASQVDIATIQLLRSLDDASISASKRGAISAALLFWKKEKEPSRVWSSLGQSTDANAAVVDVCSLFDRSSAKAYPIGASAERMVGEGFTFLKCAERLAKKAADQSTKE